MPGDFKIRGYTVGQAPNAPILVAFAALVLGWLVDSGTVHDVARAVFYVAITIWAYEEAVNGVNGFRKGIGIVGLILIVVSIAGSIA
jgi:hypothetical protein